MIEIRYVDTNPVRQVVVAALTHANGTRHIVGHLPTYGWFCQCPRSTRCPEIQQIRDLIPAIRPKPEGAD